jgi:hypothetical protein
MSRAFALLALLALAAAHSEYLPHFLRKIRETRGAACPRACIA